jgi:glycosyltransferase involved in cell wall biosynthesis
VTGSASNLRVLHLHSGNMIGGVEAMLSTFAECANLCPELESQFALNFDGAFAARLRSASTVHLLPQVRLRHVPSIYQSRKQLRFLLQTKFHVVVAHSSWIQLIYADVVKAAGLPLVFWMHSPFDGHWLQKLASFQQPHFAICNSRWTSSSMHRCYPHVKSRVIHCPVPPLQTPADRRVVRASLRTSAEEVVILMASRLQPWKGHRNLLQALARIKSQKPWRVWIAGGPHDSIQAAYLKSLESEAQSLGIQSKVTFLGHRNDIPSLMHASAIYCQPNQQPEPFGVVFVEALQAGVPVVTFSMGGAREILDGNTGVLITPGDLDGLAVALTSLIDHRERRTGLGLAGPARAQALCDPATQMRTVHDTLRSIASNDRSFAAS